MRMTTCLAQLAFATLLISPAYAQDPGAPVEAQAAEDTEAVEEAMEIAAANPIADTDEVTDAGPGSEADVQATADEAESEATEHDAAEIGAPDAEATAPAAGSSIAIPAPPSGMGQVVFFREKKFAGGGVRFKVRENDEELGKLGSGIYFVHTTEPGVHEYVVHSESEDVLTLEVEDGETYYVQGSVTMGVLVGRPNLSPTDETAFAAASAKLKPAKK